MTTYHCSCGGEDCRTILSIGELFTSLVDGQTTSVVEIHGGEDEIFLNRHQLVQIQGEIGRILAKNEEEINQ